MRALASHQCGPGLIPGPQRRHKWRLSLCWFSTLFRRFFSGFSGFPPSAKTSIQLIPAGCKLCSKASSLGVWFDRNMKFDTNITKMCAMGHFYLYNIRRIRKHLTYESAGTLTQATIIARLDYCKSLLYRCSDGRIKMLRRLQNMAARHICNSTRFCRITPLMFKLHWLPVKLRIKYKIY